MCNHKTHVYHTGTFSIDDILDDAKFNKLQPRINPEVMYQKETSQR